MTSARIEMLTPTEAAVVSMRNRAGREQSD